MAEEIKYNCGCGFKTNSYTEAAKHTADTGHSVDVSGKIAGKKKRKILPAISE